MSVKERDQRMELLLKEKVVNMLKAYEGGMYEEMAKFGAYFRSKCGISPSTAISVILGCVCLYMLVKRSWEPKQKEKTKPKILERSKSIAKLYGGDLALIRLDDYNAAVAIPCFLERSDLVLKGLLEEEHLDLKKLQSVTARLEMAGREEEGVRLLKEAKTKNAQKSHHVYEIDMLLVELLICMGKLDEAKGCACLNQQKMMTLDARRPLFKAIIYGMREDWGKAESFWNKFVDLREAIMTMGGQEELKPEISDFRDFEEKVKDFHKEIDRRSSQFARLHSGDVALRRLKDFDKPLSDHTSEPPALVLKTLLQEQPLDLKRLQSVLGRLDMAEMGDEEVKLLSEAAKMKKSEAAKSLDAYELEMLLVEMLIYKGRLDEALQCQCLNRSQKPLEVDARSPLFKAIIYGMRDDWGKSQRFWNEFVNVRGKSMAKVGQKGLDEITNFEMFKEKVQHFRSEIAKKNP